MYRGRVVGEFPTAEADVARIGELMGGHDSARTEPIP
jgi:hypothetical protein